MTDPTQAWPMRVKSQELLDELSGTLQDEISMCGAMGIRVESFDQRGLALSMPLAPNLNHQQTAFAGSLNSLCTLTGWGSVFLATRSQGRRDGIVIRRSNIRYLRPISGEPIVARSPLVDTSGDSYFWQMLREKGQAKLDLDVDIRIDGEAAVAFHGSYVVVGGA